MSTEIFQRPPHQASDWNSGWGGDSFENDACYSLGIIFKKESLFELCTQH